MLSIFVALFATSRVTVNVIVAFLQASVVWEIMLGYPCQGGRATYKKLYTELFM